RARSKLVQLLAWHAPAPVRAAAIMRVDAARTACGRAGADSRPRARTRARRDPPRRRPRTAAPLPVLPGAARRRAPAPWRYPRAYARVERLAGRSFPASHPTRRSATRSEPRRSRRRATRRDRGATAARGHRGCPSGWRVRRPRATAPARPRRREGWRCVCSSRPTSAALAARRRAALPPARNGELGLWRRPAGGRSAGVRGQQRRRYPLGRFERRPVGDIVERAHGSAGQALADPLGHVGARDRVEHPPHEGERHVGPLQRLDPAPAVVLAVAYVADQQVSDPVAAIAARRLPDVGAVGGGVVAVSERGSQRLHEQLLGQELAELRSLLWIEQ